MHSIMSWRKEASVKIQSKTSDLLDCEEIGEAQGSVLAGVFHIINSNDMSDCHHEAKITFFVGDDTDSVSAKNPEELVDKLHLQDIIEETKSEKLLGVNNKLTWKEH